MRYRGRYSTDCCVGETSAAGDVICVLESKADCKITFSRETLDFVLATSSLCEIQNV